ncbi:MAG TPA: hypothetical protein PLC34_11845 [Burkholderiaceae bacterium]|nr:hypothetical protein [Burkholderiaceae bacterium]
MRHQAREFVELETERSIAKNDGKKSRISMPLFFHLRREIVLSDRYTIGSYFEERMRDLSRNGP